MTKSTIRADAGAVCVYPLGTLMKRFKYLALTGVGACLTAFSMAASAQVQFSVGVAPECPYGYYDSVPYGCAPYGYYGPEWFSSGVFIGAGPWFHGPENFRGGVDNHFHPAHGYAGPMPQRGEAPGQMRPGSIENFHGNEMRDGRVNLR
jgi:hypothetical protein